MADHPPNKNPKNKRKIEASDAPPAKKSKKVNEATPKSAKNAPNVGRLKKPLKKVRSKRRKTAGIRENVIKVIEKALVDSPKYPPIYQHFKEVDCKGTPRARLVDVLKTLQISTYVKNTHFLSEYHWKSLTNNTNVFAVEEDEPGTGLFIKYRPVYDKTGCTVYVDNLPEGCGKEKLQKLANLYGTTADVTVALKPPRLVRRRYVPPPKKGKGADTQHKPNPNQTPKKKGLINVGSRPKSFGFIRFVELSSAEEMVKAFRYNDPTIPYELKDGEEMPERRRKPFFQLSLMRLMREIRHLRLRRRRRTIPQYLRLAKLRRRMKEIRIRETNCWKRATGYKKRRKHRPSFREVALPDVPSTSQGHKEHLPQQLLISPMKMRKRANTGLTPKKKKKKKRNGKKRRPRKKPSRKAVDYIPGGCVRRYFELLQVFSYKRYSELKEEYTAKVAVEKQRKEMLDNLDANFDIDS